MRRVLFLAALAFCPALGRADSVLQINAWATFAAVDCVTNCTETIATSFQFDPSQYVPQSQLWTSPVPGTLVVSSSGFLGSFTGGDFINTMQGYMVFNNEGGDAIELLPFSPTNLFPVGVNTIRWDIYQCNTQTCVDAFSRPFHIIPTSQSSLVSLIAVPEADTWTMLLMSVVVLIPIVGRRRRRRTSWDSPVPV